MIRELLLSASALPNTINGRPHTFVILSVNLHSLDEQDKKEIGGLTDKEIRDINQEEYSDSDEEKDGVEK